MRPHPSPGAPCCVAVLAALALAPAAPAQSADPAVFVSNNGNLEGSVTSMRLQPDGTLAFVDRNITGMRDSLNDPCAGCNAYDLSLTPDGRYIAVAHAAGVIDSVTIHRVNPDGTITQEAAVVMPTPIDVAWINDELLVVLQADFNPDHVVVYRWDDEAATLTLVDTEIGGGATSYVVVQPGGGYVYANDSVANQVFSWRVEANGTLTPIDTDANGSTFPLELAITPDGSRVYSAGGISNGGNKVSGWDVAPDGTLAAMPGSPFISPGASPSNVYSSRDGKFLFVGHGTDATLRVMAIDQVSGALTSTGFSFDVGLQGTLGDVSSAPGLVFVTDNSTAIDGLTGIYSFSVGLDGALTMNGPIALTQGIAPRSIAVWTPPAVPVCPADLDGDGDTDSSDLNIVLSGFGCAGGGCAGDLDGDGDTDTTDLNILLSDFGCVP